MKSRQNLKFSVYFVEFLVTRNCTFSASPKTAACGNGRINGAAAGVCTPAAGGAAGIGHQGDIVAPALAAPRSEIYIDVHVAAACAPTQQR